MKKPSCGQERKELNQAGAGAEEGGCRQQDVTLRYTKGGKQTSEREGKPRSKRLAGGPTTWKQKALELRPLGDHLWLN